MVVKSPPDITSMQLTELISLLNASSICVFLKRNFARTPQNYQTNCRVITQTYDFNEETTSDIKLRFPNYKKRRKQNE